jgi:hypothetical protein
VAAALMVAGARVLMASERKRRATGRGGDREARSFPLRRGPYTLQESVASISCVHGERSIWWLQPGHRAASRREEDDDDTKRYLTGKIGPARGCGPLAVSLFFFS